jgi:zinc transport system ATP-binding protein
LSVINIKNLDFFYDKELILQNINLDVYKKDFLAIIGPNGGGKSTLLKLILGLETSKNGSIKVFNQNLDKTISSIGYVPQNTNINIDFPIKVIEVVMMGHIEVSEQGLGTREQWWKKIFKVGYDKSEIACALGALKQVGMEEFAYKKIGLLSGGQRQRVMIARALCANPKILLLDEPTANIDASGQKQIYDLLKQLNEFITVVVVSHDISVILQYANKVAHINKTLTYHDILNKANISNDDHFCEVEMLQMLGDKD